MPTVYAEANFVLRLALRQEQSDECERLIEAAERQALTLALPVLALFEPLYKLRGSKQIRREQEREWEQMIVNLERTRMDAHQEVARHLREASIRLARITARERQELARTIERLCQCAHILQIAPPSFQDASKYEEHETIALESADALMLATILAHARETEGERFLLTSDSDFLRSITVRQLTRSAGLELFHKPEVLLTRLRARGVLPT